MGDLQGIKKLNNKNYNTWATCMESYLQGQDLWKIVGGNEDMQQHDDANEKIKEGKAMFALKITIEEDMLEHIRKAKTAKEAWGIFAGLFSIRSKVRLQLLENELLSITQQEMTISQYFHKVKYLCREISELDSDAAILESRKKRIIIHGLRPEFRSFVAAVLGWQNEPSLVEFENLLADQEALANQMGGVSLKGEEESLYTNKCSFLLVACLLLCCILFLVCCCGNCFFYFLFLVFCFCCLFLVWCCGDCCFCNMCMFLLAASFLFAAMVIAASTSAS